MLNILLSNNPKLKKIIQNVFWTSKMKIFNKQNAC